MTTVLFVTSWTLISIMLVAGVATIVLTALTIEVYFDYGRTQDQQHRGSERRQACSL